MIDTIATDMIWSERYRPQTVAETILPEKTKKAFQKFVDEGSVPNLLLAGPPGTGKTTAAIAMLKQLECDYMMINGSLNNGVDTLRHQIANYASSVSFSGGRKYVIVDESDYLSPNSQAGFRAFIEEFSKNCGFIFTCNFKNKIIAPLHSRFSYVDFSIEKSEKPKLAMQFFKRVINILEKEGVEFDQKVVAKVIEKHFPDFRRVLNELQNYAASGKIDEGILTNFRQDSIDQLFGFLKEKNFTEMRKWVAANSDQDFATIYTSLYQTGLEKVKMSTMPSFVVTLAKYQFQHVHVPDHELNMISCLLEVMVEVEFL
jgi:DNA polymerase III delta prime subunit